MKVHTVQKGDTLWKISKLHGISLEELIAANPQIPNPDQIDVGMQVNIPDGANAAPAPTSPGLGSELHAAPEAALDMAFGTGAAPLPQPTAQTTPPPTLPEPAYPSVPKWEGLWKYVVKHGDTMFKIAKQVGVTLEHLKAANPQVANPEKIYPGQVLNIPSSGMKLKSGNPGSSPKEQLTAPMAMQPFPKEQLLKPKEMAPVEKMPPSVVSPAMEMPMPAPMAPMPMMPAAAPVPLPDINLNLQYAPHKHHAINYAPQKEISNNFNTNIGNFPLSTTTNTAAAQQQQQSAPIANTGVMPAPVVSPMAMAPMHQTMLYYIPVSLKKKKKHKHHKCHKKVKKCGCHKKHHHPQQQLMMQQMGMFPKTFYREED